MDEVNNYVVYVEGCKDRKDATHKAVVEFIKQLNKEQ
jgi:Fe-S cluster assembly scaffold protein SufB